MTLRTTSADTKLTRATGLLAMAVAGLLLALLPFGADGQYFGRNKVLWDQFEFEVLETEHFRIHYYPPDAPAADYVARLAERWYHRLATFFDHEFEEKKPLIIYQDHADFQQTLVTSGLISEGMGGFTESMQDRIVLPLTGINADNDHVIGHELVHAFQFDMAARARTERRQVQLFQLPLWAVEGLAEYLSEGSEDATTALWMRDALLHDLLPRPGRGRARGRVSPYHYGQAVYAYIAGRWGDATARDFFVRAMLDGVTPAFERVLELSLDEFLEQFNETLEQAFRPVLDGRQEAGEVAARVLSADTTGGTLNLAPSMSPDGRWIAFLSTRELALELFLADAETGRVDRRLLRADADSHFDNLSFLDASVAWSPDSRRFAFAVFARGERRIAIYDLASGRVERRIDLPGIKGMRHAAFTPDGRSLVFSAVVDGASDLYLFELETNRLERLTSDAYTALQPRVAPDGRRVVFVTDRGPGTNLAQLHFGDLQLAVLDLDTRSLDVLTLFPRGKHIDPQFSADGRSVFFVAAPDGVPDLFRHEFATGTTYRLTSLRTGVSGITATSPALSVAGSDDAVVFSVLEDGRWNVYRLADNRGEPVGEIGPATAAVLPPAVPDDQPSLVRDYLANPAAGLAGPGRPYPRSGYRPRIGLQSIGPAAIGVGSDAFGVGVAGAMSFYFSDPLNQHQLVTAIQGGSSQGAIGFEDTVGADLIYLNQTRRLQWGARASRIPYLSSATFISRQQVDIDGESVPADVIDRFYDVQRVSAVSMLAQYPLSLNNRFEGSVGLSRIGFKREIERFVFPVGRAPFVEAVSLPAPSGIDLQRASLAFVRDTSRFGFTSPIRGTRLRLEAETASGDLNFDTALVDYRRYFFLRPFTLAMRALHVGRSGRDAEDPRLPALDVGRPSLVRGYELGSFSVEECTPVATSTSCPEFDRLFGSKIAVLNFELRVPLLGNDDFGFFSVPAAPTEGVFFIDAGAAWTGEQSVDWRFDRNTPARVPVVSAGLAARSVLFGMLPIEVFYAYPFQRPREGRVFGFRIGVGW
jgi:Tol biopolymer transport system component